MAAVVGDYCEGQDNSYFIKADFPSIAFIVPVFGRGTNKLFVTAYSKLS